MVEKASRAKICSNAGSGFELAATAIDILKEKLALPTDEIMVEYAGMYLTTMQGKLIRQDRLTDSGMRLASVNRAQLQALLLDKLFPTKDMEVGILKCGVGVESYVEDASTGRVSVTMADQSTIMGRALLGCDGINSKVRSCMHGGDELDPLRFCGCICYWGKCSVPEGSEFEREINKTQTYKNEAASFVIGFSNAKAPGSFFAVPTNGTLIWALFLPSKEPPKTTNDMTRRGGRTLSESSKKDLQTKMQGQTGMALLNMTLEHTLPSDITEAGLFDRKNLDLPYSSPGKLVALLGDAAHPQTPFLGQGVNMAIADAYVVATRLAVQHQSRTNTVSDAISSYDSRKRRKEAKRVVQVAYMYAKQGVTSNRFICWLGVFLSWALPLKAFVGEVAMYDKSNRRMVDQMEAELQSASTKNGKE